MGKWKEVPESVCMTIIIPRKNLNRLVAYQNHQMGKAGFFLQFEMESEAGLQYYSDMQLTFGTVKIEGQHDSTTVKILEDPDGYRGESSSLIVTTWVPSFVLLTNPENSLEFRVSMKQTIQACMMFRRYEDMHLMIAKMTDTQKVIITKERPGMTGEIAKLKSMAAFSPTIPPLRQISQNAKIGSTMAVLVDPSNAISSFDVRADIVSQVHAKELANSAIVKAVQFSPCAITVSFGTLSNLNLVFPFPVDGEKCKLRVARKSSYIEVSAAPSGRKITGGFSKRRFPVVLANHRFPTAWTLHRIFLDSLPSLNFQPPQKPDFIDSYLSLQLSARESTIRSLPDHEGMDLMNDIKECIAQIFLHSSTRGSRLFFISDPSPLGAHTALFVTDLKIDGSNHVTVADCCILPLTIDLVKSPGFSVLADTGTQIRFPSEAHDGAWKRLVPALVERCRTWNHDPVRCEYRTLGKIPVSFENGVSPLCSCSAGKPSQAFMRVKEWGPFAKYVTRAAVSPFFAPSFLDSFGGSVLKTARKKVRLEDKHGGAIDAMKDILPRGMKAKTIDLPNGLGEKEVRRRLKEMGLQGSTIDGIVKERMEANGARSSKS
ncbi:hypothetical protein HDU67_009767 [Dinochytrium kinnereticum]|nr:hypothetical protein HDU67_009767 [Dinochytrium kinnereticum]